MTFKKVTQITGVKDGLESRNRSEEAVVAFVQARNDET
jgi:hypothetical protein